MCKLIDDPRKGPCVDGEVDFQTFAAQVGISTDIESMANVGSAEEIEFDLYKGSFSLACGSCTLLR